MVPVYGPSLEEPSSWIPRPKRTLVINIEKVTENVIFSIFISKRKCSTRMMVDWKWYTRQKYEILLILIIFILVKIFDILSFLKTWLLFSW